MLSKEIYTRFIYNRHLFSVHVSYLACWVVISAGETYPVQSRYLFSMIISEILDKFKTSQVQCNLRDAVTRNQTKRCFIYDQTLWNGYIGRDQMQFDGSKYWVPGHCRRCIDLSLSLTCPNFHELTFTLITLQWQDTPPFFLVCNFRSLCHTSTVRAPSSCECVCSPIMLMSLRLGDISSPQNIRA